MKSISDLIQSHYTTTDYPTLNHQIELWSQTKPLAGLRILDATPLFRNTLTKYLPLLASGAQLSVGLCGFIKPDQQIITFLTEIGIEVLTPEQASLREFDIILDCAGSFAGCEAMVGYVELTRSGVARYSHHQKPVYVADSGRIKRIETCLGTGESYFRAMDHLGYGDWTDRRLVIFGAGKVGVGIANYARAKGITYNVFTELSDPTTVRASIAEANAVVTATGVAGALACYADDLAVSMAVIANMGVEDEFGAELSADRVLCQKATLNFILEEPTHLRYIETTMALHNQGAIEVLTHRGHHGIIDPSAETEAHLLAIVYRHGAIADELTEI